MNWNIVEGNWKQLKGRIRMQWGRLTHHQTHVNAGKRVVSAGEALRAFGLTADAAERRIKRFEVLHKDNRR